MQSSRIEDDDDEAFMRSLIRPEEDRRRLHPDRPWEGRIPLVPITQRRATGAMA